MVEELSEVVEVEVVVVVVEGFVVVVVVVALAASEASMVGVVVRAFGAGTQSLSLPTPNHLPVVAL